MEDVKVLVVGTNQCWGKADTLAEALSLAFNPKKYVAYMAHRLTDVNPVDGSLSFPVGCAPKCIVRRGVPEMKEAKDA
jgi:hypothetical protein